MTDMQEIFKTVDTLTGYELKQLYTYILENYIEFADRPQMVKQQPRVLGLHAHLGKAWLSDDFTSELSDEFWLAR